MAERHLILWRDTGVPPPNNIDKEIAWAINRALFHQKALAHIWICWHGIWPDGFCGIWGLAAPIGLRQRASGRWLVAPMGLACPHAEEEA